MHRPLTLALFALALFALTPLAPPATAQPSDAPLYIQVDYMKVPDGEDGAYVRMEREVWKPLHNERVRRGLLRSWNLYSVLLSTPDLPYSYVTVNTYDSLEALDNSLPPEVFEAVHGDADLEAMMERTLATREIIHSEIWRRMDAAQPAGARAPGGRYVVMNYMEAPPGGGGEYTATEAEVWKPVHQERIDRDLLSGWAMYGLFLPSGTSMHYNYGTMDFFDTLSDLAASISPEILQAAHPEAGTAALDAMMDRTDAARSIYKSELWSLIDSAKEQGP